MVDIEVEGIAKRNESAGGAGVAHGRVTFVGVVVQAFALKEAEGDTTHLVLFNSVIGLELDAENEFGGDCLDVAVRDRVVEPVEQVRPAGFAGDADETGRG